MRTIFFLLIVIFLTSPVAICQSTEDPELNTKTDTIKMNENKQYFDNSELNMGMLLNHGNIKGQSLEDVSITKENIWLHTYGLISNIDHDYLWGKSEKIYLLSPFQHQYITSQKYSIFQDILSAAQLTAVGIMAYKHIKKYGFVK